MEEGEWEVSRTISEPLPHQADPTERSWRGVLRGHVPSKSPSADGEIPRAHTSGHTEKVGEKSDSFSRAERTRPLRPVSRLLCCYLENIPVECFQRIFPLFKSTINQKGHSHLCPFFLCYCCVKSSDTARRAPANVCRTSRRLFTLPVPALRLPAFRGRSEQDRSALCPTCCAVILKTFRQNVFNTFSRFSN